MKKLILITSLLFSSIASACWYQYSIHTDYIYSVNNNPIISISTGSALVNGKNLSISHYVITNNLVVDLPLTVSTKLISNITIKNYEGHDAPVGNIIRSALQYRVLPSGDWVTVVNYNTTMDTITESEPAKTYFGKNNIYPKGLKKGDVIMVRMYITDGEWQSGDLSSKCDELLSTVSTKFGTRSSLPNVLSYDITAGGLLDVDLGGGWYPHLCFTVVYSGNERMIR